MRFHPRNNDSALFNLLSQSAQHLVTACELLRQIATSKHPQRVELREQLHAAENAADDAMHEFHRLINATFVTPLDREDLHQLGAQLDDCMDLVDEAGDCIVLYQVGELPEECYRLIEVLQRCAELTVQAMPRLKQLKDLREYWVEINSLENQADRIYRAAIARLFAEEQDPIRLIKVKEIVERLEESTDAFEDLANGVEAIAIRES